MSGLFASFNIAKRGLLAQQTALRVTNHNIANANTEGYSRQRATIETTRPFMMPSLNSYAGPGQLGTGANVNSIIRVRNDFLDYQYRNEVSVQGKYESREKFLSQIEGVFNEPSDTGISNLIGKFFDGWQQLSKQPETSNARTVVAQQAKVLADELNHTDSQLRDLKENTQLQVKETVFELNNILNQIDDLNQQIITVKVAGQEPNDLLDRRDVLIDKLNEIVDVSSNKQEFYGTDIIPKNIEGVPGGGESYIIKKDPNYAVARFSYVSGVRAVDGSGNTVDPGSSDCKKIIISYMKGGNSNKPGEDIVVDLSKITNAEERKDIFKSIDECRVLWSKEDGTAQTDKSNISSIEITSVKDVYSKLGLFKPKNGSLNGLMSVQEDVDNYREQLNKLAKGLAFSVNAIHSGVGGTNSKVDKDYVPFFVNSDKASYVDGSMQNLDDVLSSESEITASNISINEEILKNVMLIKTKTHDDEFKYTSENTKDGETDGKRALAIAQLRDTLFKMQSITDDMTREQFIQECTGNADLTDDGLGVATIISNSGGMTTDNYFKDLIDELGIQTQKAKRIIENKSQQIAQFAQSRDEVSGVSLDEEMANLIQYQHAYGANAKVISTIDELLDVVINGLKR